jgi:predicted GNAT family N-acyltransferase
VVRRAEGDADLAAVVELRRRVFGEEQGIADSECTDADDARSVLALAVVPEGAIGTGRLTLHAGPDGEAQITWVATLPAYRGRGVGTAVMRFLLAEADAAGAPLVVLSAQTHALAFYRRLGFIPFGQRFTAIGIEHQMMARPRPIRIVSR